MDISGEQDDSTIVPIVVNSAPAVVGAPATTGGARESRDPFTPSRFRPGRRAAVYGVLVVLVLAVGAYATHGYLDGRSERNAGREYRDLAAATTAVQPLLAGYTLPASIDSSNGCRRSLAACGTSALEPKPAAQLVADSLVARGLTLGDTGCQEGVAAPNGDCWVELRYDGQPVASVHGTRTDIAHRIFGAPTEVSVIVDASADPDAVTQILPAPMTDTARIHSALPSFDGTAISCSEKAKTGGCLTYVARAATTDSRDTAWKTAGAALVHGGWQAINGRCDPAAPKADCTVSAFWYGSGGEARVVVRVRPAGSGSAVEAKVTAYERVATS